MEAIAASDTCIEVCITSNLMTSSVARLEEHPVQVFARAGLPFVLCTDNPGIHARPLSQEYILASSLLPSGEMFQNMHGEQMRFAFRR
jgi:adenosine deaminase